VSRRRILRTLTKWLVQPLPCAHLQPGPLKSRKKSRSAWLRPGRLDVDVALRVRPTLGDGAVRYGGASCV